MRPEKPLPPRRDKKVAFSVTEKIDNLIQEAALARSVNRATWMRLAVRTLLMHDGFLDPDVPYRNPNNDAQLAELQRQVLRLDRQIEKLIAAMGETDA